MICNQCKAREATVHIVKLGGKEAKQMDLCPVCAERYYRSVKNKITVSLDGKKLLQAMFKNPEQFGLNVEKDADEKRCARCGATVASIRKSGLAGCPECYQTFSEELAPLIGRVQLAQRHCGAVPPSQEGCVQRARSVRQLKEELAQCIEREEYEQAAVLRDRIREMEAADATGDE